jgi:hypothetical protein
MSRARALPVAVLIVAFAAAACSSNPSHQVQASPAGADNSADGVVAQKAVLRPNDLSDYKPNPHTVQTELSPALRQQFAACTGAKTTIFDTETGAHAAYSPDFSKGAENQQQVTSSVEIDPTKADVDGGWNAFSGGKTKQCLKGLFQQLFTAASGAKFGLKYGPVQVSEFNVGVGDRSIGYAMSRSASGPAQTIEFDIDIVYVARDRAGMEFHFFNYGTNPDRGLETRVAKTVYDRIGNKAA